MPVVVVAVAGRQIDSSHSDTKKCVDSEDREREGDLRASVACQRDCVQQQQQLLWLRRIHHHLY